MKQLILKSDAPVNELNIWGLRINKEEYIDVTDFDDRATKQLLQEYPYVTLTVKVEKPKIADKKLVVEIDEVLDVKPKKKSTRKKTTKKSTKKKSSLNIFK